MATQQAQPTFTPRAPFPDPPPMDQFPPAVWPTPEHRREATIQAARAAGVSDADIAAAVGCGRPPPYFWGALVVLLVIIIYVVYALMRGGGGGGQRELVATSDSDVCTNWESASTSISGALPQCGGGAPPHIRHGHLVAYGPGGAPCHTETLTGELVDRDTIEAMAQTFYDSCGSHPGAYLGTGAYTCKPPGPKSGGRLSRFGPTDTTRRASEGGAVQGTAADLGAETLVGGLTYGNPSCESHRRR